jgi:hypothetical protein
VLWEDGSWLLTSFLSPEDDLLIQVWLVLSSLWFLCPPSWCRPKKSQIDQFIINKLSLFQNCLLKWSRFYFWQKEVQEKIDSENILKEVQNKVKIAEQQRWSVRELVSKLLTFNRTLWFVTKSSTILLTLNRTLWFVTKSSTILLTLNRTLWFVTKSSTIVLTLNRLSHKP